AMDDDLGTPAAVAVIHDLVREGNSAVAARDGAAAQVAAGQVRAMQVLGLDPADYPDAGSGDGGALGAAMQFVLAARADARAAKDWARADQIRDDMGAVGITIEDSPDGPRWTFDGGERS